MRLVPAAEMAEIDRRAQEEFGLPSMLLMENAGIKCFSALLALMERDLSGLLASGRVSLRLVFVVGTGSNAGDGLVMARQAFVSGYSGSEIVTLTDSLTGDAGRMLVSCAALDIPRYNWTTDGGLVRRKIEEADLVVDCLTGTGIRGALREPAASVVEAMNECGRPVVSIDVPSGIGDEFRPGFPAVRAGHTLTIELPKRSLYMPAARPFCGTIHIVSIGFPPTLLGAGPRDGRLLNDGDLPRFVPSVDPAGHKRRRGTVGIFAGAQGTSGAAVLVARAATRSSAGLVVAHADKALYPVLAPTLIGEMVRPWDVDAQGVPDMAEFAAVVVGPGWGTGPGRARSLSAIIGSGARGVLDADALNQLAAGDGLPDLGGRWVLTPHPGEFARLASVSTGDLVTDPVPILRDFAARTSAVLVYKSHVTYIVEPDGGYYVVDGMNPALATGGSGDVLSGLIGGLMAAGASPLEAACAGVLVHARAGRILFQRSGWFSAEDLPAEAGRLLAEARSE